MARPGTLTEPQTAVLRILEAIQPEIGNLPDIESQRRLIGEVIKKHGLKGTANQQRERLSRVVRGHAIRQGATQAVEIFEKEARLVINSHYLDIIGFPSASGSGTNGDEGEANGNENATEAEAEAGGEHEAPRVKQPASRKRGREIDDNAGYSPPKRRRAAPKYREVSSSPDMPMQQPFNTTAVEKMRRNAGPSKAQTSPARDSTGVSNAADGSASLQPAIVHEVSETPQMSSADMLPDQNHSTRHHSPTPTRPPKQTAPLADTEHGSSTIPSLAGSPPGITPLANAAGGSLSQQNAQDVPRVPSIPSISSGDSTRQVPIEEDQPRNAYEPEPESRSSQEFQTRLLELRQRAEIAEEQNADLKRELAQITKERSEVKWAELQKRTGSLERENESLKTQLRSFRAQSDALQRQPYKALELNKTVQGAPKPKTNTQTSAFSELKSDSRDKIKKEMTGLFQDSQTLATVCCDHMHVSPLDITEFITHPDLELEKLYSQILQSEDGHDWKRTQTGIEWPHIRTLTSLIAAGVLHGVFNTTAPWEEVDSSSISAAALYEYAQEDEKALIEQIKRDVAFRRANSPKFHNGELAEQAKKLAAELTVTLTAHLNRMALGKPATECSDEWYERLEEIFSGALKIKANIDTYDEGRLEFFWLRIGSRMVPNLTDSNLGQKHKPQNIYQTMWPGLKLMVEGKEDVMLARAAALAFLIDDA